MVKTCSLYLEGSLFVDKMDLIALFLSGIYCHKTGTRQAVKLLDKLCLYIPMMLSIWSQDSFVRFLKGSTIWLPNTKMSGFQMFFWNLNVWCSDLQCILFSSNILHYFYISFSSVFGCGSSEIPRSAWPQAILKWKMGNLKNLKFDIHSKTNNQFQPKGSHLKHGRPHDFCGVGGCNGQF